MKTKSIEKFVKVSPTKILRYAREIKPGANVNESIARLSFLNAKGAKVLKKAIESAKANLVNQATTHNIDVDDSIFTIDFISILKAPSYKRLRPRGRGHADVIHKRNAHIHVEISNENTVENEQNKIVAPEAQDKNIDTKPVEVIDGPKS